jgi:hypothetical protein
LKHRALVPVARPNRHTHIIAEPYGPVSRRKPTHRCLVRCAQGAGRCKHWWAAGVVRSHRHTRHHRSHQVGVRTGSVFIAALFRCAQGSGRFEHHGLPKPCDQAIACERGPDPSEPESGQEPYSSLSLLAGPKTAVVVMPLAQAGNALLAVSSEPPRVDWCRSSPCVTMCVTNFRERR